MLDDIIFTSIIMGKKSKIFEQSSMRFDCVQKLQGKRII
jgi:hypothetical protein